MDRRDFLMHRRTPLARTALAVGAGLAALVLGACGDDDDDTEKSSQPTALTVSLDKAGKVTAPASIEGGTVTLRFTNNAKAPYGLQLIRVAGNQTAADVAKVVSSENAPIPAWVTDGGGIGTLKPGATGETTQELPAGRWALVPQADEGGVKPQVSFLEVKAGGSDAALPKTTAKISAFEYGFKTSGLKAGDNPVEFSNNGAQLHHVIAVPLLPGKTVAQAKKFFTSENPNGRPPVDFENAAQTTVIDSGQKQVVNLDLKSGKYALVCFITDRSGGAPHVAKGMITEVDVT
jgi:plastocyanin